MSSAIGFVSRLHKLIFPPQPPKDADAIRFGILGTPSVAEYAFINPASSHPGVKVEGVAARDRKKADAFAKKNGISRVFDSYQELLDDSSIDAVYVPLANGLHYEWTMKALKAGKHVLVEKPIANTADEAAKMFAYAKEKDLILLEAFHYRFHPASQTIKSIVDSGAIGKVKSVEADMALPTILTPKARDWSLGDGSFMNMGNYTVSISRYILGSNPTDVLGIAVNTYPSEPKLDQSMRAALAFSSDVTASVSSDYLVPPILGFIPRLPTFSVRVYGDEGDVHLNNFISPSLYHSITTTKKNGDVKIVKAYSFKGLDELAKGEEWWTSYRHQLEAFVDKIRGRTPQTWVTAEDSVANMKAIESIYDKSGLGIRPASSYTV